MQQKVLHQNYFLFFFQSINQSITSLFHIWIMSINHHTQQHRDRESKTTIATARNFIVKFYTFHVLFIPTVPNSNSWKSLVINGKSADVFILWLDVITVEASMMDSWQHDVTVRSHIKPAHHATPRSVYFNNSFWHRADVIAAQYSRCRACGTDDGRCVLR